MLPQPAHRLVCVQQYIATAQGMQQYARTQVNQALEDWKHLPAVHLLPDVQVGSWAESRGSSGPAWEGGWLQGMPAQQNCRYLSLPYVLRQKCAFHAFKGLLLCREREVVVVLPTCLLRTGSCTLAPVHVHVQGAQASVHEGACRCLRV